MRYDFRTYLRVGVGILASLLLTALLAVIISVDSIPGSRVKEFLSALAVLFRVDIDTANLVLVGLIPIFVSFSLAISQVPARVLPRTALEPLAFLRMNTLDLNVRVRQLKSRIDVDGLFVSLGPSEIHLSSPHELDALIREFWERSIIALPLSMNTRWSVADIEEAWSLQASPFPASSPGLPYRKVLLCVTSSLGTSRSTLRAISDWHKSSYLNAAVTVVGLSVHEHQMFAEDAPWKSWSTKPFSRGVAGAVRTAGLAAIAAASVVLLGFITMFLLRADFNTICNAFPDTCTLWSNNVEAALSQSPTWGSIVVTAFFLLEILLLGIDFYLPDRIRQLGQGTAQNGCKRLAAGLGVLLVWIAGAALGFRVLSALILIVFLALLLQSGALGPNTSGWVPNVGLLALCLALGTSWITALALFLLYSFMAASLPDRNRRNVLIAGLASFALIGWIPWLLALGFVVMLPAFWPDISRRMPRVVGLVCVAAAVSAAILRAFQRLSNPEPSIFVTPYIASIRGWGLVALIGTLALGLLYLISAQKGRFSAGDAIGLTCLGFVSVPMATGLALASDWRVAGFFGALLLWELLRQIALGSWPLFPLATLVTLAIACFHSYSTGVPEWWGDTHWNRSPSVLPIGVLGIVLGTVFLISKTVAVRDVKMGNSVALILVAICAGVSGSHYTFIHTTSVEAQMFQEPILDAGASFLAIATAAAVATIVLLRRYGFAELDVSTWVLLFLIGLVAGPSWMIAPTAGLIALGGPRAISTRHITRPTLRDYCAAGGLAVSAWLAAAFTSNPGVALAGTLAMSPIFVLVLLIRRSVDQAPGSLRLARAAQIVQAVRQIPISLGVAAAVLLGMATWSGASPAWQATEFSPRVGLWYAGFICAILVVPSGFVARWISAGYRPALLSWRRHSGVRRLI